MTATATSGSEKQLERKFTEADKPSTGAVDLAPNGCTLYKREDTSNGSTCTLIGHSLTSILHPSGLPWRRAASCSSQPGSVGRQSQLAATFNLRHSRHRLLDRHRPRHQWRSFLGFRFVRREDLPFRTQAGKRESTRQNRNVRGRNRILQFWNTGQPGSGTIKREDFG